MLKAKVRRNIRTLTRGVDNLSTPLSYSNVPPAQCPYVRITSEIDERKPVKAKARAKAIQIPILLKLIDLAKLRKDKLMEDGYRDAIYCQSRLVSDNSGQLKGKNCGKHWCRSCTRIRQSQRIEKYLPALMDMKNPYRVTLHRPNVPDSDLFDEVRWTIKARKLIIDRLRKSGIKVVGLWKVETTVNNQTDTYHPHTMWVVEGEEVAHAIKYAWCELNPTANEKAQELTPITKTKESLEEIIKYTIKPTIQDEEENEWDGYTGKKPKKKAKYSVNALDIMYTASTGIRTLQPMGNFGKTTKDTESEKIETTAQTYSFLQSKAGEWEWSYSDKDWTHVNLDEKLCQWNKEELYQLEQEIQQEEDRIIYRQPTFSDLYESKKTEKRVIIEGIDCVETKIVEGLFHRIQRGKRFVPIPVDYKYSGARFPKAFGGYTREEEIQYAKRKEETKQLWNTIMRKQYLLHLNREYKEYNPET